MCILKGTEIMLFSNRIGDGLNQILPKFLMFFKSDSGLPGQKKCEAVSVNRG